jgi:hypothetical protein
MNNTMWHHQVTSFSVYSNILNSVLKFVLIYDDKWVNLLLLRSTKFECRRLHNMASLGDIYIYVYTQITRWYAGYVPDITWTRVCWEQNKTHSIIELCVGSSTIRKKVQTLYLNCMQLLITYPHCLSGINNHTYRNKGQCEYDFLLYTCMLYITYCLVNEYFV